jgi:hypothetical protein
MCDTAQTAFRALVEFGRMRFYVFLPTQAGAPPELDLAMESSDRDALEKLANELAMEIHESDDLGLEWRAASDGEEQLLVEGHWGFLMRR